MTRQWLGGSFGLDSMLLFELIGQSGAIVDEDDKCEPCPLEALIRETAEDIL